jgi:antitoxin HicB
MDNKDINYYLGLPYKVVLYPAIEGGYVVEIPELRGCISQGDDALDALKMIEDAKLCWLEIALEDGKDIPEPSDTTPSGRFHLRMPPELHKDLTITAQNEKLSLNQLIVYQLSRLNPYKDIPKGR